MIDAIIETVIEAVVEPLMEATGWLLGHLADALAWLVEAIAGLFVDCAADFSAFALMLWAVVALGEWLWWAMLGLIALLLALVLWRRPTSPARPRWWRPQARKAEGAPPA